jgi:hypothetical protein
MQNKTFGEHMNFAIFLVFGSWKYENTWFLINMAESINVMTKYN